MASVLTCYDPELDALADLAGDFDYLSTVEREAWSARQWTEMAAAMGWSDTLDQALAGIRRSRMGLADMSATALTTFAGVASALREDEARADRAKMRAEALAAIRVKSPTNLWRVELDVGGLPGGACYGLSQWRPQIGGLSAGMQARSGGSGVIAPAPSGGSGGKGGRNVVVLPQRIFLAEAGPNYFGGPAPEMVMHQAGCGWQTPLRLSLGTFPWVYGHRLQAPAPGLGWRSSGAHVPALTALEIASDFWEAEGNLRQDARDVVTHWRQWRAAIAGPLAMVPSTNSERRPGVAYRRGHLLEVFQASEELAGLNGPRGFVCVAAFNHIQRRFAGFFALRRALVRARTKLPIELRNLITQNPDPCLQPIARQVPLQRA